MRTGRPPTPAEVKRRPGNPGGRKLAAVPVEVVDPMPDWLVHAPVSDALDYAAGASWIVDTDRPMVAVVREAVEDYDEARRRGDLQLAAKPRTQIGDLCADLGFTPTARSRLGLAEVSRSAAAQRLEEMRRR
jgi:hypothetical protein